MIIWIINPYDQTPDQQATRTYEYSKILAERGHEITVIASSYNHYKLLEEKLKWYELWKDEYYDNIKFTWVKTFPYKQNDWRRILNMLSHAVMAFIVGVVRFERPNIIVGVSVPIFSGFVAYILSLFKSSKFIFEVRDLWPETLIDLGLLSKDSLITKIMRRLEYRLYVHSKKIISVLPYAYKYIVDLGIDIDKIVWLPNGVDLKNYNVTDIYDGGVCLNVYNNSNLSRKFTIMYIGRFGSYQGIDVIIEAAKLISYKYKNTVRFVLIGDGPEKKRIETLATKYKLENIEFKGLLPKKEIPYVVSEADVCLAVLKSMDVLKYGINPNKLFDYLASGRPIIFAINAINNPVADANAGITIPPQNPEALAEAVECLLKMPPKERKVMGDNGRNYLKEHFEINKLALKLEQIYIEVNQ